jgi:hypothetical protein
MLHAYLVEVGPRAVGVVTREADGYRFFAIKNSFRCWKIKPSRAPKRPGARRSLFIETRTRRSPRSPRSRPADARPVTPARERNPSPTARRRST